ncbi:hypothetical protein [Gordonia terrae]
MPTFIVSYDLSKPGRNYDGLHEFLKSLDNWAKPLQSVWIVQTYMTANTLAQKALKHMDANDHLLVTPYVSGSVWYNLDPRVDGWLRAVERAA